MKKNRKLIAFFIAMALLLNFTNMALAADESSETSEISSGTPEVSSEVSEASSEIPEVSSETPEESLDAEESEGDIALGSSAVSTAALVEIRLADGQALIFGEGGKLLLKDDPDGDYGTESSVWDTPDGYFDASTEIIIEGATTYLRSVAPATIGSITGTGVIPELLNIADGSDITIEATKDYGIKIYALIVGTENSTGAKLTVNGSTNGLEIMGQMTLCHNSELVASGVQSAIIAVDGEYSSDTIIMSTNSKISATVSGSDAIAITAVSIVNNGGQITASAPSGVGAVKLEYHLMLFEDNGVRATLEATSNSGRAFSSDSIEVSGGSLSGITPNGEIGVHVNSYANVNPVDESHSRSTVYGEADVGYGVVSQSIDDGNEEFPSGSITVQDASIEGRVNEGMGISTNMMSLYSADPDNPAELIGTAEKGVGISICLLNTGGNCYVKGTSNGKTTNRYQVYGGIAECAGINALSSFLIYENTEVIAEAPMDVEGSYGIHCILPYEDENLSTGYLIFNGNNYNVKASGDTGIFASQFEGGGSGTVEANGIKKGIEAYNFTFYEDGPENRIAINATAEDGVGIHVYNYSAMMSAEGIFHFLDINAHGGQYGMVLELDREADIKGTTINATSSGDFSVAGLVMKSNQLVNPGSRIWAVKNSSITASGGTYGIYAKDVGLNIDSSGRELVGEGGESGILFDYSDEFVGDFTSGASKSLSVTSGPYNITGTSTKTSPDKVGRVAAISVPSSSLDGGTKVLEKYLSKAAIPLNSVSAYATYAAAMNVNDYTDFTWDSDKGTVITEADGFIMEEDGIIGATITGVRSTAQGNSGIGLVSGEHSIIVTTDANISAVIFDPTDGTPVPEPQDVPRGSKIAAPVAVTKEGFQLLGWSTEENGTDYWDFNSDILTKDSLTLYAVWGATGYDVIYLANTGDPVTNMPPSPAVATAGDKIEKPTEVPQREGYVFAYWSSDASGDNEWNFANDLMPNEDLELFAVWSSSVYTITYNANGGTPAQQQQTVIAGSIIAVTANEPTRENYAFGGWCTDPAATILLEAGAVMPAEDITLYAKWADENFRIQFISNQDGSTNLPPTQFVEMGDRIDFAKYQPGQALAPTCDGYFFIGWLDGSENVIPNSFNIQYSDVVATAQWQKIPDSGAPKQIVLYKGSSSKVDIETQLAYTYEVDDLLGNHYSLSNSFEWNSDVLTKGGVEDVKIKLNYDDGAVATLLKGSEVYSLNQAEITAQESQVFLIGQNITENGDEWDAKASSEVPDFENKAIKSAKISLIFHPNDLNVRKAGTYSPYFTTTHIDYFGAPHDLKKIVEAVVIPKDGGSVGGGSEGSSEEDNNSSGSESVDTGSSSVSSGSSSGGSGTNTIDIGKIKPALDFWTLVNKTLLEGPNGVNRYISADNYKSNGANISGELVGLNRRVVARPEEFNIMPAKILIDLKAGDKQQLRLDLDFIQWYLTSADFKNSSEIHSGAYPLAVSQHTDSSRLKALIANDNSMILSFKMNKSWNGRPLMQVKVNESLYSSYQSGNSLYLFWHNDSANRLEIIGEMTNNENDWFSIKMTDVRYNYVILDKLPVTEEGEAEFVISEHTNPITEEVVKEIEQTISETITEITVSQPQEMIAEEEETPMIEILSTPVVGSLSVVCVIAIILLLIMVALLVLNIVLYKKDRTWLNNQLNKSVDDEKTNK